MQRETLEIWDRLGIGERVAQRGMQWNVGRTYFRDRELFSVQLPGSGDDHFPPFVNISQTEVEELLRRRLGAAAGGRPALGPAADRAGAGRRRGETDLRHGQRTIHDHGGLRRWGRWCPLIGPAPARHGIPGSQPRGPVPDLRHPRHAALPQGAALLLRPAVESRPPGARPSAAGRPVAHRLAGPIGDRCRGGARLRRPGPPHPPGGGCRDTVRAGMGDCLPLPPAAGAALPRRPRAAGRRCRAPDEPVRRARPELRGGRRREPGLEAGPGAGRPGAGGAARQLRRRAPRGGGREPGRHRRQHAVHGPARTAAARRPQRHPARQRPLRHPAPARQLGATVTAVHLRGLAGRGTAARGRAPAGARLGGAGCALHPSSVGKGMSRACAT